MKQTKIVLFVIFLMIFAGLGIADSRAEYEKHVKSAWELFQQKDFENAAVTYEKAFAAFGGKATQVDRYNCACAWAMAQKNDKAFQHLFHLAEKAKYHKYDAMANDKDLRLLIGDPRWRQLAAIVKKNQEAVEAKLNKSFVEELTNVYNSYYENRKLEEELKQKFANDAAQLKKNMQPIINRDAENLKTVTHFLDKNGWLGTETVGDKGVATLYMIIYTCNDVNIMKKYLPQLKEAAQKGLVNPANVKRMEDKIAGK